MSPMKNKFVYRAVPVHVRGLPPGCSWSLYSAESLSRKYYTEPYAWDGNFACSESVDPFATNTRQNMYAILCMLSLNPS